MLHSVSIETTHAEGANLIKDRAVYIVQGHRFDIYEDLGCRMFIHSTHLSFVIAFVPPLALGTISSIYAGWFFFFGKTNISI